MNPVSSNRQTTRAGAVRRSSVDNRPTLRLRNASFAVLGFAVCLGWLLGLPAAWNTRTSSGEAIPANQIAQAGITPPVFFFDDQADALDQLAALDTDLVENDLLTNTIRRTPESKLPGATSADSGVIDRSLQMPFDSASQQNLSTDTARTHAIADKVRPAATLLTTPEPGNAAQEVSLAMATSENDRLRAGEDEPGNEPAIAYDEIKSVATTSTIIVKRGDTLSGILNRQGISIEDMPSVLTHDLVKNHLSRLEIGQQFELTQSDSGQFQSLSTRVQGERRITISKTAQGKLSINSVDLPVTRIQTIASGHIDQSLYLSAEKANLQQSTIMELADIFQWELDFARDIQQGDQFSLIYDRLYREGEYIGDGNIIAAQFVRSGRKHTAIRFENANSEVGYFSPNGKSKKRTFMRHPVDVVRITSRFNPNRLHPVLHQIRAHRGVDYGAPYGSPIYATADGVVKFAGNQNAYGKTVILQHGKKLSTLYAHMSKISGKTRAGSKVRQGDVIGYVGKSGRVTGVHLHYEFRVNGVQMDPLAVELPAANPIDRKKLTEFKVYAAGLQSKLENAHVMPDESVVKATTAVSINGNLMADNKPLSGAATEFK